MFVEKTLQMAEENRAKLGQQITFALTAKSWKQYQYIGPTVEHDDFCNVENWNDMAGMSAGKEPFINIDDLCGKPTASDYYSFESAIDALVRLEASSGVTYRKAGMVITYRISESEMETLQLKRKVTDFGTRAAWGEFGGGGNKVVTKDDPAEGGKDAFSTGGAYNALPVDSEVKQEDGVVNIQLLNAAGNAIMPPISFAAATGGGTTSGTVVSMKFRQSPLSGALGQNIVAHAAIRSITMAGNNEVDNAIAKIELFDRDTNLLLWSSNVNKASSVSMEDFSFDIDFTPYFEAAGKRNFTVVATDEGGNTGQKYITVTADGEDATYYVGEETTDGRWYVLTPDGRVLYASAESKALLSRSIYDMAVLPQLPVIAPEQVVSVTILTPERTVAFLTDEDGVRRSANRDVTAQTAALVEELGALTVTACVDYHPAEGAAAVCGLDESALTLAMNYLSDTGADKALTLAVGLPTGDGGRYVTLDGETTIYRMEEASLAQLLTIANTGRNIHRHALTIGNASLTFAFRAGILNRFTNAIAFGAGGSGLDSSQKRLLNAGDTARAVAVRARDFATVFA